MCCCCRHRQQQQSSRHIMHQVPGIAYQVLLSSVFDAILDTPHMWLLERGEPQGVENIVYRSSTDRVWRVEISYLCSIVAKRPGDGKLNCGNAWCTCSRRDQTSMVVVYNTYLYSKFSVVLPLYGPARHSMMQCWTIESWSRFSRQ